MKKLTKKEAIALFKEAFPRESFIMTNGEIDDIARREAWNNWTDMLCKDGEITPEQDETWTNPF